MGQANTSLGSIGKDLDSALKSGEAQFSQLTTPSNPLEVFQTGRRVSFLSKTSCKYLRCLPDGNLDSLGVLDAYSNFFVTCVSPNRCHTQELRIQHSVHFICWSVVVVVCLFVCLSVCLLLSTTAGLLACRGTGGPDCEFSASITTDSYVILEAVANPGHHIGTLNTGAVTNPAQTLKVLVRWQISLCHIP